MATKAGGKQEYIIVNIGSGIQVGSSLVLLGVAETLDAAKKLVRGMGAAHPGKILIARKETVITRTPVIDLKETNETLVEKPKP